jgi:hypothetical protein
MDNAHDLASDLSTHTHTDTHTPTAGLFEESGLDLPPFLLDRQSPFSVGLFDGWDDTNETNDDTTTTEPLHYAWGSTFFSLRSKLDREFLTVLGANPRSGSIQLAPALVASR